MILHQFSGRRNRASQVDFNFNLLPQVPTGSTFSTTLDGVSNNGAVVSFTITAPGNVTTTYPASGNSASFLTSHASAGSYTYSGFATDAAGNKSATVTKTITVIVDGVIPYMRHTLNTASSIQNGSTNTFNIFYGADRKSVV